MTNDTTLAFDSLDARARAAQSGDPPDRISLRDLVVEADIGAFQVERGAKQRLRFSIVVEVAPAGDPIEDDVDRILSYDSITEAIDLELAAERLNLLETLAERIAERILTHAQAQRVFVRIEKLDRGPGALGVEIVRSRAANTAQLAEAPGPALRPLVVFLPNEAIAAKTLPRLIDDLQARGQPVVFCVGPADRPAPAAGVSAAQRRIDLLAMEQNAWVLAGRDPRCIVMQTRTELDWAAKHGQIAAWAPSKMVLDAVDGPGSTDPLHLADWLCNEIGAAHLCLVGEPPNGLDMPVEVLPLPQTDR